MTNPNLTLVAALLDRSGSMADCKRATETGFDELIAKQRSQPGDVIVTLSMFDDEYENVYANRPIADVEPLDLLPRNMTAMLDAIGRFVTEVGEHLAELDEAARPGTVICLIMTDGYENASEVWSWEAVKALITQQRQKYDWQFIFLGANIDALAVGSQIGVPTSSAMTFSPVPDAVESAWASSSEVVSQVRRRRPRGFTGEERDQAMRAR
jgi:hypothetical protein